MSNLTRNTNIDLLNIGNEVTRNEARVSTINKRAHFCAVCGHIYFNLTLAVVLLLFSTAACINTVDGYLSFSYSNSILVRIATLAFPEDLGITHIVVALASPLVISFAATLVAKILSYIIRVPAHPYQLHSGISAKKQAESLLSRIKNMPRIRYSWDDHYPMHEVGSLVEINLYNLIPWLSSLGMCVLGALIGIEAGASEKTMVILVVVLFLLIPEVLLWKLSSIINSVFYRGVRFTNLSRQKQQLENYLKECEAAERARLARIQREQAERESARKKEEERQRQEKAAELYELATQTENADYILLKQAADLGHPAACKEIGKALFMDSNSSLYTKKEQEEKCMDAASYLEKAKDIDVEADFLWLSSVVRYESHNEDDWFEYLQHARSFQNSDALPDYYKEPLRTLIESLVEVIDRLSEKQSVSRKPKSTRWTCKFFNAGICNRESSSTFIYHCNYDTSPYLCETARTYGGAIMIEE